MSKEEQIDLVIANCYKAMDYYIKQHSPTQTGPGRVRTDAVVVKGIADYIEFLKQYKEEITPKKKRGNPNFGKNNPYLPKEEMNNG